MVGIRDQALIYKTPPSPRKPNTIARSNPNSNEWLGADESAKKANVREAAHLVNMTYLDEVANQLREGIQF